MTVGTAGGAKGDIRPGQYNAARGGALAMIRVLHVCRAHSAAIERKIDLIEAGGDFRVYRARSAFREAAPGGFAVGACSRSNRSVRRIRVLRRPDPHRGLWVTLSFGVRSAPPDLIHAEEEPDSLAALQVLLARRVFARRAPVILHTWQNLYRPLGRAARWVLRRSLGAADAILSANREGLEVLARRGYQGITARVPQSGFDPSVHFPRQARRDDETFTVVFVGRLAPEKGVDILLDALARLGPPSRACVVGRGPAQASLEMMVARLGLTARVSFTGQLAPAAVAERLAACDVLVLPSRTTSWWKEQFGRVLVEAMACRVPVVGSDSGAIPEVVGEAGLTFPEGDAAALAERLSELRGSPALRADLAERGYRHVMDLYTPERLAAQTAAAYRLVVGTGAAPAVS
jgi:glycosyltransferase involved in cell wall biosynthesis